MIEIDFVDSDQGQRGGEFTKHLRRLFRTPPTLRTINFPRQTVSVTEIKDEL